MDFPEGLSVEIPGLGLKTQFERAPLFVKVQNKEGQVVQILVVHMKSKRPKFLEDEQGQPLEDRNDPKDTARAALRSLIIRGAEAVALRHFVVDALKRTREPLVVMGDFNDSTHSVTTQLVAATSEVAYNRAARDVALFDAYSIQGENALKKNVAYSHIYQGSPEVLDQILLSEEFVPGSKFAIGDVRRVDYFNDHLHEGRNRGLSDHGFVRAVLRLYPPAMKDKQ
jgi:predicted extracellular nuclease